jgi:hypothetical protein
MHILESREYRQAWCLTLVTLATWEAEFRRIRFEVTTDKKLPNPISNNNPCMVVYVCFSSYAVVIGKSIMFQGLP